MPRSRTLTVEVCGEPVTGLWCDRCRLPSGIGIILLIGNQPLTVLRCHDCRARL